MELSGPREVFTRTPGCVTIAVLSWPPLLEIDRKPFTGIVMSFARLVMEGMKQCYYLVPSPDQQFGDKLNGTWTGMIGMIERKEADIAIGPLSSTLARLEVVNYAFEYMNNDMSFMYKAITEIPPNMFIFAKPYVISVWVSTLISIVMVGLAGAVIHRGHDLAHSYTDNEVDPSRREDKSKDAPLVQLMWSLQMFLGQDERYQPKGPAGRVLCVFWGLMTLILATTYKCNLKALIITSEIVPPIDSLDDIVKQTEYKWTLVDGTYYGGYFKSMYETAPDTVAGKMWPLKARTLQSSTEVIPAVIASKVAVVTPRFFQKGFMAMDFAATGKCRLAITKKGFHFLYQSFAYSKNYSLRHETDMMLLRVAQAGLPYQIMKFGVRRAESCMAKHQKTSDDTRPFALEDFYGFLILFMLGQLFAILVLFGEIYVHRIQRKRERPRVRHDLFNIGRDAVIGTGSIRSLHTTHRGGH